MAARTRSPRGRKAGSKHRCLERPLRERRFRPIQTSRGLGSLLAGGVATISLGAGVYGQWLLDTPHPHARWLFAGGAIGLGLALLFGDTPTLPVRVGEAGVAVEGSGEFERLAWWQIESITLERDALRVRGRDATLSLPRNAHPAAIAELVKEAKSRCPQVLQGSLESDDIQAPGKPQQEPIDADLQLAGVQCAASERPITLERDACLCPRCARVYHREHLPERCVSCDRALDRGAIAPGFDRD